LQLKELISKNKGRQK